MWVHSFACEATEPTVHDCETVSYHSTQLLLVLFTTVNKVKNNYCNLEFQLKRELLRFGLRETVKKEAKQQPKEEERGKVSPEERGVDKRGAKKKNKKGRKKKR